MSTGIIFGIGALLCWGLENSIVPAITKKIGPIATIFWRYLWEVIIFIPIFLYFFQSFHFDYFYILLTIAIAFIGYIPVLTFYQALKIGKIGVVSPVASSSIVITTVLSIVIFQESLTPWQIASIIVIVSGVLLMSINFSDFKSSALFNKSSGLILALITCLLWGVVFALFRIPVNILGPILTAIVLEVSTGVYAFIFLKLNHQNVKFPGDKKLFWLTFLVGSFGVGGIILFNYGIQNYNVSLIAPIAMSNPILPIILGRLIYKERLTTQQTLGATAIILGIISISL